MVRVGFLRFDIGSVRVRYGWFDDIIKLGFVRVRKG